MEEATSAEAQENLSSVHSVNCSRECELAGTGAGCPGSVPFVSHRPGGPGGDPSVFDFSAELPGWFPMGLAGASADQPSLLISPISPKSGRRLNTCWTLFEDLHRSIYRKRH